MRVRRARIQLTPDSAEEPMRGACVQPAQIKEWSLMMVDEQFPLQRKILKGQVVVRNEEASVCARCEMNDSGIDFRIFLLLPLGS